jgi:hypothetical protein
MQVIQRVGVRDCVIEAYLVGGALAFTMKDIRLLEQKSLTAVTLKGVDLATPTMGRLFNDFPSFEQYCQVFQTLVQVQVL